MTCILHFCPEDDCSTAVETVGITISLLTGVSRFMIAKARPNCFTDLFPSNSDPVGRSKKKSLSKPTFDLWCQLTSRGKNIFVDFTKGQQSTSGCATLDVHREAMQRWRMPSSTQLQSLLSCLHYVLILFNAHLRARRPSPTQLLFLPWQLHSIRLRL